MNYTQGYFVAKFVMAALYSTATLALTHPNYLLHGSQERMVLPRTPHEELSDLFEERERRKAA